MTRLIPRAAAVGIATAVLTVPALAASPLLINAPTWKAARKAAGFTLLEPRTAGAAGLALHPPIAVDRCMVNGQLSKRQVDAIYGSVAHGPALGVYQTNAPFPCGDGEETTALGHVAIHGHKAALVGVCGSSGQPSCHSAHVNYMLSWHEHSLTLITTGVRTGKAKLIAFSRSLHPVS